MTEYDYAQNINNDQILDEIATSGISAPAFILTDGTQVQIFYNQDLSDTDKMTLDSVVAAHVANPTYVTLAVQAQVAKLTAYLNSAVVGVAPAARAAIVGAMASKLPLSVITQINAVIQSQVGF